MPAKPASSRNTLELSRLLPGPPMPSSPLPNDMVDFRSTRPELTIPLSTETFRKSSGDMEG